VTDHPDVDDDESDDAISVAKRDKIISYKAARLIVGSDAPDDLKAMCVNAVRATLIMAIGSEKDLRLHYERSGKRGRKMTDKVRKLLVELSEKYPLLPLEVQAASPVPHSDHRFWINWIERLDKARKQIVSRRFHYKAQKKLNAAQEAYSLLKQFHHKEITAEKNDRFCKLAALLCGLKPAQMQWTCRGVLERERLRP